MKNQNLAKLIDLERANPVTLREYCHRDGCPTTFERNSIKSHDVARETIEYKCQECDQPLYRKLRYEVEAE